MSLIRNERLKLLAPFMNGVAVGCVTTGVVAQTFTLVVGGAGERTLTISLLCVILASDRRHPTFRGSRRPRRAPR